MVPPPSEEQKNIVKKFSDNHVIVDAVAGSGKTTTTIYIGKEYSEDNILLLTYNAKLKLETRKTLEDININNIEVHTYHSFCVKYYDHKCFTDKPLKKVVDKNKKPLKPFNYNRIICDEAQDITPLYFRLIHKIYNDNESLKCLKCIMGDEKQSIYQFNGSDERFITRADILFNNDDIDWIRCDLSTSFRITKEMADFINKGCLKNDRIISHKEGFGKPIYLKCNVYENQFKLEKKNKIFRILENILDDYCPEDIFILAPSIKSDKTPVRVLENKLKTILPHVNIYIPVSDEEKIDPEVIKGKIVFSTFHQSKGLERKVALVYNVDDSYFTFYKKNIDPTIFVNELYVAFTRASEKLVLIHNEDNLPLQFLDFNNIYKLTRYIHSDVSGRKIKLNKDKLLKTAVTDITRHIQENILDKCMEYLDIQKLRDINDIIDVEQKTKQKNTVENVCEITGTAIPFYYESMSKNEIKCIRQIPENENKTQHNIQEFSLIDDDSDDEINCKKKYDLKKINVNNLTDNPDELLYIANRWCSYKSGFLTKIKQITEYDWLSKENLIDCKKRMDSLELSSNCHFEKKFVMANKKELFNRELIGFVDCIDRNRVYEFKCVNKLENEHFIQLAIYAYLIEYDNLLWNYDIEYSYYLYNILSDEMYQINIDFEKLKIMIEFLIKRKYYSDSEKIPDKIFIKNMLKLLN